MDTLIALIFIGAGIAGVALALLYFGGGEPEERSEPIVTPGGSDHEGPTEEKPTESEDGLFIEDENITASTIDIHGELSTEELPQAMPHRSRFVRDGVTSVEELYVLDSLESVHEIGEARAGQVATFLKEEGTLPDHLAEEHLPEDHLREEQPPEGS
jgi:hypothetical protein